jgi:putrescine importer
MIFTAVSYGKIVKAFPSAGSAYTYTQKTMGPHLGFLVGWSSLLDYLLLPMVNALLVKIYLLALFPDSSPWIWVTVYVLFVTAINIWSINSTANFNTFLVIYQVLIVCFFIILATKNLYSGMGYGRFAIDPFYGVNMNLSGLITGATVLCFSYIGFDAVTTYSEETPNPSKTIPRAIILTALIGGIIFTISSYIVQSAFPDLSHFKDTDDTTAEIALYTGGKVFQLFLLAGSFAGSVSSGLASHASVSRLLYVMGRDNVLPKKFFGYIHPRFRTPVFNVIFVGLVCFTAVFFDLETATSFINFGALTAFTFVNLSVIAYYAVKKKMHKTPKEIFSYVIMPLIGAGCIAVLWSNLESNSFILGLGWALIGFIYLMYLTKMFKIRPAEFGFDEADETFGQVEEENVVQTGAV